MPALTCNATTSHIEQTRADAALAWVANRSARVTRVLIAVAALSLVDLFITLQQMLSTGMFEGNAVVRMVIAATGSPLAVVGLKLVSLIVAIGLLHRTREHAKSEAGAWIALGILIVLTVQWIRYLSFMAGLDDATVAELGACSNWVAIG